MPSRAWYLGLVVSACLLISGHGPLPTVADAPVVQAVEEVPSISDQLTQRRRWLLRESLACALHEVANISEGLAREITSLVEPQAYRRGLSPILVTALIVAESRANPKALSPAGARGLMQIMPETGRFIALSLEEDWLGASSLWEIERNLRYGTWYLSHLREIFPGNRQAFLAAYNWGPDHIEYRLEQDQPLPRVYPGLIDKAQKELEKRTNDYYRAHYWRSLDLRRDPPPLQGCPDQP